MSDDEIWREFGPGGVGMGWDSMLLGLAIHLGTGESIDPAFGQTVDGHRGRPPVPDARPVEGWYTASVAGGEDASVARALTDRCIKAYLGEEEN